MIKVGFAAWKFIALIANADRHQCLWAGAEPMTSNLFYLFFKYLLE